MMEAARTSETLVNFYQTTRIIAVFLQTAEFIVKALFVSFKTVFDFR
jgi:hypothetical protein